VNTFISKRNQVYPILWHGRAAVEKWFDCLGDWVSETGTYAALWGRVPVAEILESAPGRLVTSFLPGQTLLDELQREENTAFSPAPWEQLSDWLIRCQQAYGKLPPDGNLRNYLWDGEQVTAVDLECYQERDIQEYSAELIAYLLGYSSEKMAAAKSAADLIASRFSTEEHAVKNARRRLLRKRHTASMHPASGIILAGGRSSRMGRDKAFLELAGIPLLEWQIRKLKLLGIQDIIISGDISAGGARPIKDIYPDRGPLGGLHACLQRAKNSQCLVLAVDTPLVPLSALVRLCRAHQQGVTLLSHASNQEPLIGVYDRTLAPAIEQLIKKQGAPIYELERYTSWTTISYKGPPCLLQNSNTPKDFKTVCEIVDAYAKQGISLF